MSPSVSDVIAPKSSSGSGSTSSSGTTAEEVVDPAPTLSRLAGGPSSSTISVWSSGYSSSEAESIDESGESSAGESSRTIVVAVVVGFIRNKGLSD